MSKNNILILEPGIPMPEKKGPGTKGKSKYEALRGAAVGSSFAIKKSSITSMSRIGKILGIKLAVRKLEDGTYRCWKTA